LIWKSLTDNKHNLPPLTPKMPSLQSLFRIQLYFYNMSSYREERHRLSFYLIFPLLLRN